MEVIKTAANNVIFGTDPSHPSRIISHLLHEVTLRRSPNNFGSTFQGLDNRTGCSKKKEHANQLGATRSIRPSNLRYGRQLQARYLSTKQTFRVYNQALA